LSAGGLDVEDGNAQVAIVLQGQFDEALQARVTQKVAPAQVGGRHLGGRRRSATCLRSRCAQCFG
jgi:hypothetical protein